MPINRQDQSAILHFFDWIKPKCLIDRNINSIPNNRVNIVDGTFSSECATFAVNLIEHCTRKQIVDKDLLFYQKIWFHSEIVGNYNQFLVLPPGSLLAIQDTRLSLGIKQNRITHYIVKVRHNYIVGNNHGGIFRARIGGAKGICRIFPNDFIGPLQFIYDERGINVYPNANVFHQLVCIDYDLR